MKRFLLSLALLCVMVMPSPAQQWQSSGWQVAPQVWQPPQYMNVQNKFEPPQAPQNQPNASVPSVPQAPIVVTAPPPEKVNELPSWGTVLGGIITALAAWIVPQLVSVLRAWAVTAAGPAGALVNNFLGDRLEKMVENGMFKAASELSKSLDGKIPIGEKSVFQQKVADYVQEHGAELIEKLGGHIGTGGFFDAIKARVEKKLIDPKFPIEIDPASVQQQHGPQFDLRDALRDIIDEKFGGGNGNQAQAFSPPRQ